MNQNTIDYKKYFSKNLYQQGGASIPFFITTVYQKAYGILGGGFFYQIGQLNYGYFDKDVEKRVANKILNEQEKDRKYIDQEIKKWKKFEKEIVNYSSEKGRLDFKQLPDKELRKIIKDLIKLHDKFWSIATIIEVFDPEGAKLLLDRIKKSIRTEIKPEELQVLVTPVKLSFLQEERLVLLETAKKIKKASNINKYQNSINQIQRKYFWSKSSWARIEYLSVKYFENRIRQILKNPKQINEKIQKITSELDHLKVEKKELYKKYKFPQKIKNLLYLYEQLSDWRDKRKGSVYMAHYLSYVALKEISKREKIDVDLLSYLSPREINNDLVKMIPELKRRRKSCFHFYHNKKEVWLSGKKSLDMIKILNNYLFNKIKIVKGMPASVGKLKGKVKIINTKEEFKKLKKGDILISVMTRPDFMPILSKAAAIVTDEGGLTCHAAIVSREFKIPCIIGTQSATKVFKDGDKVEVDANKGVIKKI